MIIDSILKQVVFITADFIERIPYTTNLLPALTKSDFII